MEYKGRTKQQLILNLKSLKRKFNYLKKKNIEQKYYHILADNIAEADVPRLTYSRIGMSGDGGYIDRLCFAPPWRTMEFSCNNDVGKKDIFN